MRYPLRRSTPLPTATLRHDLDLALWTLTFAAVCAGVLWLPTSAPHGLRVLALAATWYLGFWAWTRFRPNPRAREMVAFLLPLSLAQIFPDWLLSAGLKTLDFPADGGPRLDTINLYMGLLWTIALLPCLWVAERVFDVAGRWTVAAVVAGLTGLVVFSACEILAAYLPLWHAVGVRTVGPVALYVVPAEVALSIHAWTAWRRARIEAPSARLAAGLTVSLAYTGSLGVSWLVFERLLFSGATP